ncbi:MAG: hypothetical protein JW818_01655 [Pirellulales bacterium]|nr:hypothetical protein [Pirellulales bacterium]
MNVESTQQEQEEQEGPLNLLGLILVLITVVISFAFALWFTPWFMDLLGWPAYPRILLVIPIVLVGLGFWIPAYYICKWLGIPLQKAPKSDEHMGQ